MPEEELQRYAAGKASGELGTSAKSVYNLDEGEEYLPALKGKLGIEVFERMRRSDSQCSMTLDALKNPLLNARWEVLPSERDPQGEEIAEHVRYALFDGMTKPWAQTLWHALLMLDYGYMPHYRVLEVVEKPEALADIAVPSPMWRIRKLAPRFPVTVVKWERDPEGSVTHLVQEGLDGDVPLPIEELVVFTHKREGDDWTGRSILRTCYMHWFIRDRLLKIDAMGHERERMGVPTFRITPEANFDPQREDGKALLRRLRTIAEHLHANEKSHVIEIPGVEFRFEVPQTSNTALLDSANYHDGKIAVNILGQFLNLGTTETGSRAVASEQKGPFDGSVLAVAQNVCDTFQHFVIPHIVEPNWGPRPELPRLTVTKLRTEDMAGLASILSSLVTAEIIVPDDPLEDWIRDMTDLPPRDEASARKKAEPQVQAEAAREGSPKKELDREGEEFAERRPGELKRDRLPGEEFVAFEQIDWDLAEAKDLFSLEALEALEDTQVYLVNQALQAVSRRDPRRVAKLSARKEDRKRLRKVVRNQLADLVGYGLDTVRSERDRAEKGQEALVTIQQRREGVRGYAEVFDPLEDEDLEAYLDVRADQLTEEVLTGLTGLVATEALRQVREGSDDVLRARAGLREAAGGIKSSLGAKVGQLIPDAFGQGRSLGIREQVAEEVVVAGTYSAMLDHRACPVCRGLDGHTFTPDQEEFTRYADGNSDECKGRFNCRCLLFLRYGERDPLGTIGL